MSTLVKRAKYVLGGEDGALNLQEIIAISAILVIATALFIFRDKVIGFLTKSSSEVDKLKVK